MNSPVTRSGVANEFIASSKLGVIDRKSLKDQAVILIQQAIGRRELKPGEIITEAGLGKKLGISQVTAREALQELEFCGFIQKLGPRKKCITSLTRQNINEVYAVRTPLEALTVDLLCHMEAPDLSAASVELKRMFNAARAKDLKGFCDADLAFHRALWNATGNSSLVDALERIVPKIFAFDIMQRPIPSARQMLGNAQLHSQLLDLIQARDTAAARNCIECAMQQARHEDTEFI